MPFHQNGPVRYFTFDSLADLPLHQAVFTRQGGVSPAPWRDLNLGGTVGDDPQRVLENRQRAFRTAGLPFDSLYDVWQVHSAEVVSTDRPRPAQQVHLQADAILTDQPGVTLFMRFADCVPILLYDPQRKVAGLVHAGWLGTVRKIAARAVEAMQAQYHSDPAQLLAAIGPSIAPHHYQVGRDVIDQVRQAFGADASGLLHSTNGAGAEKAHLDLWSANRLALEHAGVRQVEISGLCTACALDDWFSHRGEAGKTGRFGVLIALKG